MTRLIEDKQPEAYDPLKPMPELVRACVDEVKALTRLRVPAYELPADSFIEAAVLAIIHRAVMGGIEAGNVKRPELAQEYGQDHPWIAFNQWHQEFHDGMPVLAVAPIAWPCRQPLRCFWRWTRKTGVILDQSGIVGTAGWAQARRKMKLPTFFEVGVVPKKRNKIKEAS